MIREQTKPVAGCPLNGSISSVCVEETPPTSRPCTLQTTLLVVATSELLPPEVLLRSLDLLSIFDFRLA
eukprot:694002-Rhodomonas_salina.1